MYMHSVLVVLEVVMIELVCDTETAHLIRDVLEKHIHYNYTSMKLDDRTMLTRMCSILNLEIKRVEEQG